MSGASPAPSRLDIAGAPVVAFSSNDWSDIPSSTSQLMTQLARSRTVLYIDTIGIRTPRLTTRDAQRALGKLRRAFNGARPVGRNLYVWSPLVIPFHGSGMARRLNARLLSISTRWVMRRLRMRNSIVYAALPSALDIVKQLPRTTLVYHCIDDYREFTDAPREAYELMEDRLSQLADLTVVSSSRLLELRRKASRRAVYLPHGVDLDWFEHSLEEEVALDDIDAIPGPIAGFVGRIGDWIDVDLIFRCAQKMPDWSFVVVGPTNIDLSPYSGLPNLFFLGLKPFEQIPHYVKRFKVALLPFVDNEVSASVNPLKLYEYLAVGVPVVSTPALDMTEFAEVVEVASLETLPAAIRAAADADSQERRDARRTFVRRYSWESIAGRLLAEIEETVAAERPRST